MQTPPEQSGVVFGQMFPHEPQFALSFFGSAQYGAPPSAPASGKHSTCVDKHVLPHLPLAQTCNGSHALPQLPQFALSVPVLAQ